MTVNTENKVWYLKQVELLKGISENEIIKFAQDIVEKECKKKELLYTPFEMAESVYLLKKGEVTLYHSHNGKKIIIDVLGTGSIFGNISFKKENNTHFAEVSEESYICILKLSDLLKLMQAKPELMLRLLEIFSHKISDYEKLIKSAIFDSKEKVLQQLEILSVNKPWSLGAILKRNVNKITHEKLAQRTGLTRETVTRALQELKKEGRVVISDDGIRRV